MKKIFYILASAIVALGAVACENDGLDNIGLEVNGDTVSFIASIDNTKTDLSGLNTIWDEDDTIVIEWDQNGNSTIEDAEKFSFTNTKEEVNKFSCSAVGLSGIVNANITATYSHNNDGNIDSNAGTAGALLTYTGSFEELKEGTKGFKVENAFLKFTTTEKVTLKGAGLFVENGIAKDEITITGTGKEQYVAVNPTTAEIAFSYSVDGVQCKSLNKNFTARTIYGLGELYGASDWEISDGTRLLKTATPDLFVAKNVKLAANNFCLHKVGDTAWGAGAKYGLVTAGNKSVNTAIGVYSANWSTDITVSNASTEAHDIYFDKANSRVYVMTVGTDISTVTAPTHSNWYNIAGSMNSWGNYTAAQKFTYCGDNVWHLIINFKANDEFKVQLKNGWSTCYGHNQIQSGVGRSLSSGSDNAKIRTAGTYEIWVVPAHSDAPLYIIKK